MAEGKIRHAVTDKAQSVIAVDLDVSLLERLGKEKNWTNVQYFSKLTHLENYMGKVDLIIAMDVLEHVDDLNDILCNFNDLLSLNGSILVSGPTENLLYKIGRKLANYSGEYHTSNIHDIVSQLGKLFTIHRYKTLFPVFDFFEIYIAKKKDWQLSPAENTEKIYTD